MIAASLSGNRPIPSVIAGESFLKWVLGLALILLRGLIMMRSFSLVLTTVVLCVSAAASGQPVPSNSIPVVVGDGGPYGVVANQAFISIKLCQPGTQVCQIIDHIELDTGSVGLRIFKSALGGLSLPNAKDGAGNNIGECFQYGGGETYWGSIEAADVRMAGEVARNIKVQIVDYDFEQIPAGCPNPDKDSTDTRANGVMGTNLFNGECYGADCEAGAVGLDDDGLSYYSCAAGQPCTAISMPLAMQLQNPISLLSGRDNNGYLLQLPFVGASGTSQEQGQLIFGIDTQPNNRSSQASHVIRIANDGYFTANLQMNGITLNGVRGMIDSGTDFWNLPAKLGAAVCADAWSPYLCPEAPETLNVSIPDVNGNPTNVVAISIANAQASMTDSQAVAYTNIAMESSIAPGQADLASEVYLGMAFYYGRTVIEQIGTKSSNLGQGSLIAFTDIVQTPEVQGVANQIAVQAGARIGAQAGAILAPNVQAVAAKPPEYLMKRHHRHRKRRGYPWFENLPWEGL